MGKGGVFNLSKHQLTNNQEKVLQRGLNFAPTNQPNSFNLFIDTQKFIRKLTLKKYFMNNNAAIQNYEQQNTKVKTTFIPSQEKVKAIETKEKLISRDLEHLETNRSKDNLTKGERQALKELAENETIIIKPADKGGGTVIMDTEKYKDECDSLLREANTYRKLEHNPLDIFQSKLKKIITRAETEKVINITERNYILIEHPKVPLFYILPKIH